MLKFTRSWLVVFAVAFGCFAANAKADDSVRTVAITGGGAPETTANFSDFFSVRLNNAGQVAFRGHLVGSGADSSNNRGIWSEGGGSLALVARRGSSAPGTGDNFSSIGRMFLNNAGQVAFLGSSTGSISDDKGIWSNASGSLALVAHEGSPAPGTGGNYTSFGFRSRVVGTLVFNDAGQVAFRADFSGDARTNQGIWSEESGSLKLVVREGNAAPGTDANFSGLPDPVFNNVGQIAFPARIIGSAVDDSNDWGIWSKRNGALALVVREGAEAPGTNADFSSFSTPQFNNAGQIAFRGDITGDGVDDSNNVGIWSEGSGSLALVVREGDEAPGTSDAFSFLYPPTFNDAGQTAFSGTFGSRSLENSGIWSERGGSLELVAQAGETAPGTHATFSTFIRLNPLLNDAGQVAFSRQLEGPGVDTSNDLGIWAEDALGKLTLIAREGEPLDVSNGPVPDLRTISGLSFDTGSGFNDMGQVAFRAEFTDGSSGVFVSNLAAVPEPSSLLLLSVIGISLFSGGRGPRGGCHCRAARIGDR